MGEGGQEPVALAVVIRGRPIGDGGGPCIDEGCHPAVQHGDVDCVAAGHLRHPLAGKDLAHGHYSRIRGLARSMDKPWTFHRTSVRRRLPSVPVLVDAGLHFATIHLGQGAVTAVRRGSRSGQSFVRSEA